MNHGAHQGLCAPASYADENHLLYLELAELRLSRWAKFKRWLVRRFSVTTS